MYLKQKELDVIKRYVYSTTFVVDDEMRKDIIGLLEELDARQKADSDKTWAYIKEKRKKNPNYAR